MWLVSEAHVFSPFTNRRKSAQGGTLQSMSCVDNVTCSTSEHAHLEENSPATNWVWTRSSWIILWSLSYVASQRHPLHVFVFRHESAVSYEQTRSVLEPKRAISCRSMSTTYWSYLYTFDSVLGHQFSCCLVRSKAAPVLCIDQGCRIWITHFGACSSQRSRWISQGKDVWDMTFLRRISPHIFRLCVYFILGFAT